MPKDMHGREIVLNDMVLVARDCNMRTGIVKAMSHTIISVDVGNNHLLIVQPRYVEICD